MSSEALQRRLCRTLLKLMQGHKQWDETVLINATALEAGATTDDARLALDHLAAEQWATSITGTWGTRKWTISDAGRAALLEA